MPRNKESDSYDTLEGLQYEIGGQKPILSDVPGDEGICQWRRELVRRLRETWVLSPDAKDSPKMEIRKRYKRDGYELQKIVITGTTGHIPGYLLLPNVPIAGGAPNVGALCIHGNVPGAAGEVAGEVRRKTLRKAVEKYRDDYARRLARRGVTCLVMDNPGQGERTPSGIPKDTVAAGHPSFEAMCLAMLAMHRPYLGQCLADLQVALKYLQSRPDVDARRVGSIGFSMGGTLAAALAVVDCRLRCCLFSGYVTSWRERFARRNLPQTSLTCIPDMLKWFDMPDILAAVAPRPLIVVAEARGKSSDERRWLNPVQTAYHAHGMTNQLRIYHPPKGPHQFYPDPCLAWYVEELKKSLPNCKD